MLLGKTLYRRLAAAKEIANARRRNCQIKIKEGLSARLTMLSSPIFLGSPKSF